MSRPKVFARWVRSNRAHLGVTQAELGAMLGVSKQTVYLWESGRALCHGEHLLLLQRLVPQGRQPAGGR